MKLITSHLRNGDGRNSSNRPIERDKHKITVNAGPGDSDDLRK